MLYEVITRHVCLGRQVPIEHVELTLDLHRVAIDRVFDLGRCVGVEVAETAPEKRGGAHLPEQPRQALGARAHLRRHERSYNFV